MIAQPQTSSDDILDSRTGNQADAVLHMVNQILSQLDDAGIAWCVLRNRDRIPSGLLEWDDLDLMVSDQVSREEYIKLFADLGLHQIVPVRAGYTALFFPVAGISLRVDLYHGDIEWRAAAYGLNQEILAGRRDDHGIMVASGMHQAFLAWFSKLLREGTFKARYAPMIIEAMRERPDDFRALLKRTFGSRMGDQLADLALSGRPEEAEQFAGQLRRLLFMHALRRHPVDTLGRFTRQLGNAVQHRLMPTGVDVALLGPDGAGKSTLGKTIAGLPSRRGPFTNARYRPLYHRMFPTVGDLESKVLRKPRRPRPDAANPHGVSPYPTLKWFALQVYYLVDHWLSELVWNRTRVAHTNLIVHDRHPIEIVIDPKRYRYAGPRWLARLMAKLVPQPDLLIILDAPADVIQARKQDVTFEETARQRQAFRALAQSLPNARVVDASQPFEEVMDDVIEEINEFVATRARRRFGLPSTTSAKSGLRLVTSPTSRGAVR